MLIRRSGRIYTQSCHICFIHKRTFLLTYSQLVYTVCLARNFFFFFGHFFIQSLNMPHITMPWEIHSCRGSWIFVGVNFHCLICSYLTSKPKAVAASCSLGPNNIIAVIDFEAERSLLDSSPIKTMKKYMLF